MNKSNKNIDISTGSIGPIESTGPSDCPDSTGSTESSFALHVSVEPFHVLDNCGYGLIKITNVLSTVCDSN